MSQVWSWPRVMLFHLKFHISDFDRKRSKLILKNKNKSAAWAPFCFQERDITAQIWSFIYTQIWSKKGPLRWDEIFLLYSRTALLFANLTADPLGSAASLAINAIAAKTLPQKKHNWKRKMRIIRFIYHNSDSIYRKFTSLYQDAHILLMQ